MANVPSLKQHSIRQICIAGAIVGAMVPMTASRPAAEQAAPMRPELVLQVGHAGAVNAIGLSADGSLLVSGSDDSTIKIWDVRAGRVLRTLYDHEGAVLAVALSADGRFLASAGQDGRVRVWDVTTGAFRIVGAHRHRVNDVAFSTDALQLTSLGATELKVWDVASARELRSTLLVDEKDALASAMADRNATALTADGRLAAVGGGFSYRGGFLLFGSGVRAQPIRVIEALTGREVESFKVQGNLPTPTGLRFSRDGRLLVAKLFENQRDVRLRSPLIVYDVGSGREIQRIASADSMYEGGIEFSPDGKLFASRSTNLGSAATASQTGITGSVALFDVATWQQVRVLPDTYADAPSDLRGDLRVTPMTFSGDGRSLAMSFGEGVAVVETATGRRVRVLRTTAHQTALAGTRRNFAADDQIRAMGADPDQWRQAMSLGGGLPPDVGRFDDDRSKAAPVSPIAFTPDGKQLSALTSATVWDTVTGTPGSVIEGAQRMVSQTLGTPEAVSSADGRLSARVPGVADMFSAMAAGNQPVAPAIWEVKNVVVTDNATGQVVQTIALGNPPKNSATQVGHLAFNPHGLVVQYCDSEGGCHVKTFDPLSGRQLRDLKLSRSDSEALRGMFGGGAFVSRSGRFFVSSAGVPKLSGARLAIVRFRPATVQGALYTIKGTDVQTGRKVWEVEAQSGALEEFPAMTFGRDDAVMAVATIEKERWIIQLRDTTSGRVLRSIDAGDRTITGLTFSPDGARIALTYQGASQTPMFGRPVPPRSEHVVAVYDVSTGRQQFALTHDTSVRGAAFSPNGRLIATVAEDRNQYLWDADTGEPLATLVNLDVLSTFGGSEWLVVTPDGLFDGSPGAWQQILWRFSQNTFDVGPVEIFFNELYYPGLAADIFSGRRPKAPRDLQQIDWRQPNLNLTVPAGESAVRNVTVTVDVAETAPDAAHTDGSGAKDVRLFRNGTLVKLWRGDVLNGQSRATLQVSVPIVAGENRFTAYAFNRENVKSVDAVSTVVGSRTLGRKGTAYVLAVGVNQYDNAEYNLKFAGADAVAFAGELKAQQAKLVQFDRVEVVELLDRDATKANLLLALRRLSGNAVGPQAAPAALAKLAPAQPEDAVFIYFAGHGTARGARFYLVPHDLGYSGPRANLDAGSVETILNHSVSDIELEAAVEGLDAGALVLVVDACNSGQALEAEEKRRGPMNSKGLAQLAYEKGMYILTAAQSYQAALETSQLGHGYLTFALVNEGLKQALADRTQKDGFISVREWFDYATARVPELQQTTNEARLLLAVDEKQGDQTGIRNLQTPRAFYRGDAELFSLLIGKRD